ncbi:Uma2 family endonuclease [Gloeobacter violaceus]|uniref:Glr1608 protein n=1 Tax=Gloeobacter violaceus (strain ATCC 29082 / PCC 7421) TaxID=251221 RepID=Q7NK70_GLOVI|nr:Uma2 family endonuclease [Gloeobacter violaceus]BAC89549.1 glr1608 [Gloeobacter violaceus PCC 7421]
MWYYDPTRPLPSSAELPDSDDAPVDNELQELIPVLLRSILDELWQERRDWLFAIDMGVYYDPELPAIVPDGFISLGVERVIDENLRPSYVLWEENGIVPCFVLEVVSQTYRGEYDKKLQQYARLGVPCYAVYDPSLSPRRRRRHAPLEVYRLVDGAYQLQPTEGPVWIPQLQLALGREAGTFRAVTREWLYWYDERGNRYPTPGELLEQSRQQLRLEQQRAEQERQRAEQERQRAEVLERRLRELGVDPDG